MKDRRTAQGARRTVRGHGAQSAEHGAKGIGQESIEWKDETKPKVVSHRGAEISGLKKELREFGKSLQIKRQVPEWCIFGIHFWGTAGLIEIGIVIAGK